jgi:hypothetical protein
MRRLEGGGESAESREYEILRILLAHTESPWYSRFMKIDLSQKIRGVKTELESLERQAAKLRGQLEVYEQWEAELAVETMRSRVPSAGDDAPTVKVANVAREGITALPQFTRPSLVDWIRKQYPNLDFSPKSIGKPLQEMLQSGEVVMIRENAGNKTPAVYAYKRKASAG